MHQELKKYPIWVERVESVRMAVAGLMLSVSLAQTATVSAQAPNCMQDVAGLGTLTCTAADVKIGQITRSGGPDSCVKGQPISLPLQAELVAGANERYDIGVFVGLDGGNAITGQCYRDYLNPIDTTPTPASQDRFAPFFNGESTDTSDACGDLEQGVTNLFDLNGGASITLTCEDFDNNGFLDVGSAVSWDNTKNNTCVDESGALPNTKSKCNDERIEVIDLVAVVDGATLTIIKDTLPDGPQDFAYTSTGGLIPAAFNLDDDSDTTLSNTQTYTNLLPGSYTVTETAHAGFELTGLACVDPDEQTTVSLATGTANIDLDSGETVVCTYQNSLLAPSLEAQKADALLVDTAPIGLSPGDTLEYTITIVNGGSGAATGVKFDDPLSDPNLTLIAGTVTASQGTITSGNTSGDAVVEVDVAVVSAGATVTISYQATIADPLPAGVSQVANQGIVQSNESPDEPTDDPDTPDDDDPTTTAVGPPAPQNPPAAIPTLNDFGILLLWALFLVAGILLQLRNAKRSAG